MRLRLSGRVESFFLGHNFLLSETDVCFYVALEVLRSREIGILIT